MLEIYTKTRGSRNLKEPFGQSVRLTEGSRLSILAGATKGYNSSQAHLITEEDKRMETYRNQTFEGKSFILEEVAFIQCKLTDCDLYYSGGDFDWANSNFENCRFHWRGTAKNTIALLQSLGMISIPTPPQNMGLPKPKVN